MELSDITDFKAEAGVVSTLVYHPEFILHSSYLHEKYFYDTSNACIYWAIRELYNQKITNITALNIEQMLESNSAVKRKMQEFNMPSMHEFIELCEASKRDTVEEYILVSNKVVELAFKREFFRKANDWQRLCVSPDVTLDDMSNRVYQELNGITTQFVTDGEITTFGSKVDNLWQEIQDKKERGESFGFPSYFQALQPYFTYEKTELVVVEARMKMGKSILAMIEGIHKASNGVATFIQDGEMSDSNFYVRCLAYLTGYSVSHIKNDSLTSDELKKITEVNKYLEELPLYHNYDPYITKEQFYSICCQKKIEMNLEFVIWDYIKGDDSLLNAAEQSAYMGGMTNFLKNRIAGGLDLAVLAFCQLNRNMEVAQSDGIEKYCSVACQWNMKTAEQIETDGFECGTHYLRVKLNRLGPQQISQNDYIDMVFMKDRLGIQEAKKHTEVNPYE